MHMDAHIMLKPLQLKGALLDRNHAILYKKQWHPMSTTIEEVITYKLEQRKIEATTTHMSMDSWQLEKAGLIWIAHQL